MTDTPSPDFQPIIEQAAAVIESMRSVAPDVTEAVVRYTFAQGVTGLVFAGLAFLTAFISAVLIQLMIRKVPDGNDGLSNSAASVFLTHCFVIAFALITGSCFLAINLPKVLAPEGATIMNMIEAVR